MNKYKKLKKILWLIATAKTSTVLLVFLFVFFFYVVFVVVYTGVLWVE